MGQAPVLRGKEGRAVQSDRSAFSNEPFGSVDSVGGGRALAPTPGAPPFAQARTDCIRLRVHRACDHPPAGRLVGRLCAGGALRAVRRRLCWAAAWCLLIRWRSWSDVPKAPCSSSAVNQSRTSFSRSCHATQGGFRGISCARFACSLFHGPPCAPRHLRHMRNDARPIRRLTSKPDEAHPGRCPDKEAASGHDLYLAPRGGPVRSLTSGIKARPKRKVERCQGRGRPTKRMTNSSSAPAGTETTVTMTQNMQRSESPLIM